jgi:hypothetical protein
MNTEIKVFEIGNSWDFKIILSEADSQARLFRTRYVPLFKDGVDAERGANTLLALLVSKATLYMMPDNSGWIWELWQPAYTDEAEIIIESMLPPGGVPYGTAQGDGLRWAIRLGMEV